MIILYVIIEFLCGSLMLSYWLGLAVKKDLTKIGDGNPGAFNLWHAAGFKLGLLGVFLEFMKGYLPLVIFVESGLIKGFAIIPAAIAPILGHAFSPFMKFKGGKAIDVSFGVWSAVTRFEASFAYAVILALMQVVVRLIKRGKPIDTDTDGFMVVTGMFILGIYLMFRAYPLPFILLWLGNFLILAFTNRKKLYRSFKGFYSVNKQEDIVKV